MRPERSRNDPITWRVGARTAPPVPGCGVRVPRSLGLLRGVCWPGHSSLSPAACHLVNEGDSTGTAHSLWSPRGAGVSIWHHQPPLHVFMADTVQLCLFRHYPGLSMWFQDVWINQGCSVYPLFHL